LTDRPHGAVGDVSSYDVDAAAGLAVQHLKANGHRKVGFLNPRGGHALFSTLKRAFLREAAEHGMNASVYEAETRARWPLEAITTQDETGPLIDQWRVEKEALRPTALFVPADSIAVQAYAALRARGLRVGKDVSLASCNREVPLIQSLEPALTTIDIHAEALGSNAVELLASRIERRMREPQARIVVQPELVEGASVCNCLPEEQ
ncbi:MAG TPA: LacI family DNA-binding transcriptional regulator, partial [Planctomycetota bacterium]|nr:LacI family DNA-binding transcriptional regulator [Planctomycetota bacterium]